MFKGKYILSPIHELKRDISNYLNIDCDLIYGNENESDTFMLVVQKSKLGNVKIEDIIWKIVGNKEELIRESLKNEVDGVFNFNMQQCSFMLCTIFNINSAIFDTEIMFSDSEEYIYLFYVDTNEISLNFYNYKCICGADFYIQSNSGDNGVLYCPYCGKTRNDMGDNVFEGEFNYIALEDN